MRLFRLYSQESFAVQTSFDGKFGAKNRFGQFVCAERRDGQPPVAVDVPATAARCRRSDTGPVLLVRTVRSSKPVRPCDQHSTRRQVKDGCCWSAGETDERGERTEPSETHEPNETGEPSKLSGGLATMFELAKPYELAKFEEGRPGTPFGPGSRREEYGREGRTVKEGFAGRTGSESRPVGSRRAGQSKTREAYKLSKLVLTSGPCVSGVHGSADGR